MSRVVQASVPRTYRVAFDDEGTATIEGASVQNAIPTVVNADDQPIADAFAAAVSPEVADLVDVAAAVYAADRLCKRGADPTTWARRMEITVPVRSALVWGSQAELLNELLGLLTGDEWQVNFFERHLPPRLSEAQGTLFSEPLKKPAVAMLFSGGLDSLAGLVRLLKEQPDVSVATVSIRSSTRIHKYQRMCHAEIAQRFAGRVRPIGLNVDLVRGTARGFDREDRNQRARGFLFQMIGVAAALIGEANTLAVPENGIGAMNLPYSAAQFGTQAGRAATPLFVAKVQRLVSAISGAPFNVVLPNLFCTKGELLTSLRSVSLEHAASETVSCDRFNSRIKGSDHCGTCTSCLLRRQSLHAAGLRSWDSSSRYRHDVWALNESDKDADWFGLR